MQLLKESLSSDVKCIPTGIVMLRKENAAQFAIRE
jgi:hypothetical protein